LEHHEFHTHQNHFLVLCQDNFEVNGTQADHSIEGQFLDTVQVPLAAGGDCQASWMGRSRDSRSSEAAITAIRTAASSAGT